jgi:hypothetical protein
MGENRASWESILGNFVWKEGSFVRDNYLPNTQNTAYLYKFNADKLKYVHTERFGYNKCKFNSATEAALMIKSINGEKKYDW